MDVGNVPSCTVAIINRDEIPQHVSFDSGPILASRVVPNPVGLQFVPPRIARVAHQHLVLRSVVTSEAFVENVFRVVVSVTQQHSTMNALNLVTKHFFSTLFRDRIAIFWTLSRFNMVSGNA